jgi:serine/threonine protein kinase
MAPEAIGLRSYSPASDVWSFAIFVVELWNGKMPYENTDLLNLAIKIRDDAFSPAHSGDLNPKGDMPEWLVEVCNSCWVASPSDRPSMKSIAATISSYLVSLESPRGRETPSPEETPNTSAN